MKPHLKYHWQKGFTFIEVLIAMLIFTMALVAAVDIVRGSVRATRDSKQITLATWLVQNKMVETETKLETLGFEKACEKKLEGKFDAPYETFTWRTQCYPVDFKISESAAHLAKQQQKDEKDRDESSKENQILKLMLDTTSKFISQSMRELHVEVAWMEGKTKRQVYLTTQVARYDLVPQMSGIPNLPATATSPGTPSTGTPSTGGPSGN